MSNGLLVLLGLTALVGIWSVVVFNRLVRSRNQMNNAFAQIDVQLKRRHDLIPNLVNTAKGYLQHERQTLEAVTLARQRASDARSRPNPTQSPDPRVAGNVRPAPPQEEPDSRVVCVFCGFPRGPGRWVRGVRTGSGAPCGVRTRP